MCSKSEMRRQMLARRQHVHEPQTRFEAHIMAALERLAAHAKVVAGYHPVGSELDPQELMQSCAARGARLALPVCLSDDVPLVFRELSPNERLIADAAGIAAPPENAAVLRPDVLLVPLLAFDAEGWRLGRGKGHYDRTLADLRRGDSSPVAIGIAYDAQEIDKTPRAPHDQRLDAVLTPTRQMRWGR